MMLCRSDKSAATLESRKMLPELFHLPSSHSEAMERSFLTFLYADRYIITVGYMDTSTVELFDFLEKLSFQEVSLS